MIDLFGDAIVELAVRRPETPSRQLAPRAPDVGILSTAHDDYTRPLPPRLEVSDLGGGTVLAELLVGETNVGFVGLERGRITALTAACVENVNELIAEFGPLPIYNVEGAHVDRYLLGKGWGVRLYEAAFAFVAPALVVTGGCAKMGTSPSAFRVWKSLARRYPSRGSTPEDSVVAAMGGSDD